MEESAPEDFIEMMVIMMLTITRVVLMIRSTNNHPAMISLDV
jgi:hypothetical protein